MKLLHRSGISWILAALSFAGLASAEEIGTRPGQVYPDIELPTIDGERTIRLSELRGVRVLLVEFASW